MKLSEIAETIGCTVSSEVADTRIKRLSSLGDADGFSVTFLSNPKLAESALATAAAAVIVKKGVEISGKTLLEVDDPYLAYAKVARLFEDTSPSFGQGIHSTASVDDSADIDGSAHIGPGSVIGSGVRVGAGTIIDANCVLEKDVVVGALCRIDSGAIIRKGCRIGDRVIIQSLTVVGSDGFANAMENGAFVRIPCFGTVVIEDDAHIGAGVTIDRGNFGSTIVRKGARIDNLVHIAHNVEIGRDTALAAQVGISGSTKVGDNVLIGGQAGFVGHITIGDKSFVGAKAGVSKDVKPGAKVTGYPARDFMRMRRIEAAEGELPALLKEVKKLKREIEGLRGGGCGPGLK